MQLEGQLIAKHGQQFGVGPSFKGSVYFMTWYNFSLWVGILFVLLW